MKLTSLFSLVILTAAASAQNFTASFDTIYDQASESLDVVACSNGVNGLESKGFTTFGSLPDAYDEQVALCAKLESAETELVRNRVKARIKAQEKLDKEAKKGKGKQKQMLFTLGSFPT